MSVHGRNDKAVKKLQSSHNSSHKKGVHITDPIMHSPDRTTTLIIGKKLK